MMGKTLEDLSLMFAHCATWHTSLLLFDAQFLICKVIDLSEGFQLSMIGVLTGNSLLWGLSCA
jgi:hypothetical protein